jgi:hypothetical protein
VRHSAKTLPSVKWPAKHAFLVVHHPPKLPRWYWTHHLQLLMCHMGQLHNYYMLLIGCGVTLKHIWWSSTWESVSTLQ